MRLRPLLAFALATLAVLALGPSATEGNSNGAAGAATAGCTCHNQAPDANVQVNLTGLPEAYVPGTAYPIEIIVQGPAPLPLAQNRGGFALEVEPLGGGGGLAPVDGATQATDGKTLTHTAAGNDARSWKVTWMAPLNGTGEVTLSLSAMAVNGNAVNDPLDAWNRMQVKVPEATPPPPPTPTPTPQEAPPAETPGVGMGLALVAMGLVAVAVGRRG